MRIDIEHIERSITLLTWFCIAGAVCIATRAFSAENVANRGYILHIQMTPAVCSFDPARKKQRKCLEGYAMTVAGLVPETTLEGCETNTTASLPLLQTKVVARIIPDDQERQQLWRSVGGCMPMGTAQYFRTIVNYAQDLKIPSVLTDPSSHSIGKTSLESQFARLNPRLPADGFVMSCQSNKNTTLLTHISICYKGNGNYKSCPVRIVSNCPANFTIKGIY